MRKPVFIYGATFASVFVAGVIRWLLDPALGDQLPYPTFFVAVIVAAWIGGLRPAVVATGLGLFGAWYFFIPPRYTLSGTSAPNLLGLGMYLMVSFAIAGFGEAMRVGQRQVKELAQQREDTFLSSKLAGDSLFLKHRLRDVAVIGFGLLLTVLLSGGFLGYRSAQNLNNDRRMVDHTYEVIRSLERLLSTLKDAETWQRGYLLSEDEKNLEAYEDAVKRVQIELARLKDLTSDNHEQQTRLAVLETKLNLRLDELQKAVALMKQNDRPAALGIILNNTGNLLMDDVRSDVAGMQLVEQGLLKLRADQSEEGFRTTILSIVLPAIIGIALLGIVFYLFQRSLQQRQRAALIVAEQAERLRTTLASIGDAVITTDLEARITNLNPVAEKLTGWSNLEARGKPLATVFNIVNEDTRQPVASPAWRALKDGVIVGLANHTILIAKDGSERAIDDSAAPIRCEAGQVVGCVLIFRDISGQRKLQRQASLLASVVQSSEDAIISKTLDGIIQSWNAAAERLFGYKADQAIGRHISLLIPADRANEEEQIIARVRVGERLEHFDTLRLRSDGTPVHVSLTISPVRDETGEIIGISKIARDITQRQSAEEKLRQSEALKTAMFQTALDCIISINHEGKILEFNPAAERTFGYTAKDVLGQELAELIIPPSFRQQHRQGMARYLSTGKSNILDQRLELTAMRSDGSEIPVELAVTHISSDGPPVFTAYLREITGRKQAEAAVRESEARYRAIGEAIDFGVWMCDAEGRNTYASESFLRLVGITQQQCAGDGWGQVLHPDEVDQTLAAWKDCVQRGGVWDREHRFKGVDGQWHYVLARGVPIKDIRGVVLGWAGINLDIDRLKKSEAALIEVDRRKDEFLATLAHELRNPLAPVRNAVQVLHIKGPSTPELQWARDVIDRQMQGMTRLIDDLMDVSRINRDKLELRRERVELAAVVQGAIETSRPLIEEHGHQFSVTLPPEPIFLNADLHRLAQVFLNLLNNAAKYTDAGGRIDLRAERQGSDVVVSVKDTGIGISADHLPKLFTMFSQVENSLSRSQGGLGIGLALVKRLVEMHGGSIEAHSEGAKQGSLFAVRLPIEIERPNTTVPTDRLAITSLNSKLRILVVDDNRDAASTVGMLLKLMGNTIRTAHDGEEAVQAAGEFRPQVILLDIGLPKMNGYDAARKIRQTSWGAEMILIAVTGWGQEDDRKKSKEAGFDHHMVKPVDPQSLMKLLAAFSEAAGRNPPPLSDTQVS